MILSLYEDYRVNPEVCILYFLTDKKQMTYFLCGYLNTFHGVTPLRVDV